MTKIIFATGNKDKLREIKEILSDCDVDIRSMKEAGINVDIVEDGKTFEDNALIKARAIAAHTDAIVLADDSGLEIDYLNKEPGVYSGYDPIFYLDEYGCSSAELTPQQKNAISHRGKALRAMKEMLVKVI